MAKVLVLSGLALVFAMNAGFVAAQTPGWSQTGERVDFGLTDDARLLRSDEGENALTEFYAIDNPVPAGNRLVIQVMTVREGHPDAELEPAVSLDFARRGAASACPRLTVMRTEPGGAARLPSHLLEMTCPANPAEGVPESRYYMVAIRGRTRAHSVTLISGPTTSAEMLEAYIARIEAAQLCDVAEAGGPCNAP